MSKVEIKITVDGKISSAQLAKSIKTLITNHISKESGDEVRIGERFRYNKRKFIFCMYHTEKYSPGESLRACLMDLETGHTFGHSINIELGRDKNGYKVPYHILKNKVHRGHELLIREINGE